MVAAHEIKETVLAMENDKVFSVADLGFPYDWYDNVRIKLSRMEKQGLIVKVSQGKYYKPRQSVFGTLQPSREEIVKDLLVKNGKAIGYLTGYSVWNKMGLTSQISNIIEIGVNYHRNRTRRGNYDVRFVLQPNQITRANIPLLQILDAVKAVKTIPDATANDTVTRLTAIIANLSDSDIHLLAALVEKYQPQTRSLTGAILEMNGHNELSAKIRSALHPATVYKIGVSEKNLPNRKNWNIT